MSKVPSVIFKTRVRNEALGGPNPFEWKDLSTDEVFKGKKVVVFSLPGAFTPTCSTSHLPRYEELYDEFKAQGVDSGGLPVGQRRLRDVPVGQGPERQERLPAARRQRRIQP